MVGQILLIGFRGTRLDPANPVFADIQQRHLGGVVLFDYDVESGTQRRNITSPDQLMTLCAELQAAVPATPLLIAVDQEGGEVQRLGPRNGFPGTRSAADVGADGTPRLAIDVGRTVGSMLRNHGVNLNFAPVVDLNLNPDSPIIGALGRSYSADPAVVSAIAEAIVLGHRDTGVLTCLKHFPGHGSANADTHVGFVDVTATWSDSELEPYRALIPAGLAECVMAAHVFNAGLDPDHPASLSSATIDGLLRRELGFEGVVITDDLQMGAITSRYSLDDAVRLALTAGADILAAGNNLAYDPALGERLHATVMDLVASGAVAESRVAEAYGRVAALKERLPPA